MASRHSYFLDSMSGVNSSDRLGLIYIYKLKYLKGYVKGNFIKMILSLGRVNLFQKGDISGKSFLSPDRINLFQKGDTSGKTFLSPARFNLFQKGDILGKIILSSAGSNFILKGITLSKLF